MTRLSILIGMGFMLVGALAYTLPPVQDGWALIPAFAGIIMSLGGLTCAANEKTKKFMCLGDIIAAVLLLIYSSIRISTDATRMDSEVYFTSDLDVFCLSIVIMWFAIDELIKGKRVQTA